MITSFLGDLQGAIVGVDPNIEIGVKPFGSFVLQAWIILLEKEIIFFEKEKHVTLISKNFSHGKHKKSTTI